MQVMIHFIVHLLWNVIPMQNMIPNMIPMQKFRPTLMCFHHVQTWPILVQFQALQKQRQIEIKVLWSLREVVEVICDIIWVTWDVGRFCALNSFVYPFDIFHWFLLRQILQVVVIHVYFILISRCFLYIFCASAVIESVVFCHCCF